MTVTHSVTSCLGIILGLYGYESAEQQSNFIELLALSETNIPKAYISSTCPEQMEYNALDWFIKATQEKFYARSKGERWEQKIPTWIIQNAAQVIAEGKQLGVLDKTYPKESSFECAAIFGSTAPQMQLTITDLKDRVEAGELSIGKVFFIDWRKICSTSLRWRRAVHTKNCCKI